MTIMYLSNKNLNCLKQQISLYLSVLIENCLKPDIISLVNSIDPDQLAPEEFY